MMNTRIYKSLLAILAAFIVSGCTSLKPFTAEDFRQMGYNIQTQQNDSK
jgi:hypothetical protein